MPKATPIIENTPTPTASSLSGTLIPETPATEITTPERLPHITPNLTNLLIDAISNVCSIKTTTGANVTLVKSTKSALEQAKTITQKLLKEESNQVARDLNDIKKLLTSPKTYAQAVTAESTARPQELPTSNGKLNAERSKAKSKEREKFTLTITAQAAPENVKNALKSMHAKDLIQKCQNAIAQQFKEGHIPKIHGINKRNNDTYKIHCESEKDPQLLNEIDWSAIFKGVTVSKRKYGLVIHGVPKKDLDPNTEDQLILRDELEEENTSRNLQVEQVTPLRRTQKHLHRAAAHHSIVIFTTKMQAADECLERGMFIKGRFYSPEKYSPELNVTQCYNCFKFGHMAKHCKNTQKCGNCGEDAHCEKGEKCTNTTKCAGCEGPHPAWHKECGERDAEGNRVKALKRLATDHYSE
jgi:hypothetical protein